MGYKDGLGGSEKECPPHPLRLQRNSWTTSHQECSKKSYRKTHLPPLPPEVPPRQDWKAMLKNKPEEEVTVQQQPNLGSWKASGWAVLSWLTQENGPLSWPGQSWGASCSTLRGSQDSGADSNRYCWEFRHWRKVRLTKQLELTGQVLILRELTGFFEGKWVIMRLYIFLRKEFFFKEIYNDVWNEMNYLWMKRFASK